MAKVYWCMSEESTSQKEKMVDIDKIEDSFNQGEGRNSLQHTVNKS